MKKKITGSLFILLFFILAYNMMNMPTVPTIDAPSYNDSIHHYIKESVNETGATNIVAAILADYRAFDTLGETIVLFTSIVAVSSVLRTTQKDEEEESHE
jgi:multisubunit Na+/H+ antiporter MnhB subunit